MNEWALPTIALLLIGYGAVSARLQTTMVSQAMVFTAAGLLVGSWALDLVDVDAANQFVRHLAEATLAVVLFTDAVGVNPGRLRRESLVPARLLGVGLPLTIVAGTLGGLAAPGASADAGRGDLDGGVVGVRPRPHRLSRRQPLRRLVRRPRQGPCGHAREPPRRRAQPRSYPHQPGKDLTCTLATKAAIQAIGVDCRDVE
jgi:hypothetical protein